MKKTGTGRHKKQKSVTWPHVSGEEIEETKQLGLKIKEKFSETDDEVKREYLTKSYQTINFLECELDQSNQKISQMEANAHDERNKIILLESEKDDLKKENLTLKAENEEKIQHLNQVQTFIADFKKNFSESETNSPTSTNSSSFPPQLKTQLDSLQDSISQLTPKKHHPKILSFFGIVGGTLSILFVIWEQWQKKILKEQLEEFKQTLKRNLSNK